MAFDAGAAVGRLELDSSGFTKGILSAEAIGQLFPGFVADFIANPLLGIMELAHETGDALVGMFKDVAGEAQTTAIQALKLGVSTEWLSEWTGIAKSMNVGQEQLANGMFMLNERVGQALQGGKEGAKGFEALGISMQWLKDHAGDTAAIFEEVEKRISALPNAQMRSAAAQELLGRGARELIPIFSESAAEIQHQMDVMKQLGDVTTEAEAKSALALKKLQTDVSEAMSGIEKQAMGGLMDYLATHSNELEKDILDISAAARQIISDVIPGIGKLVGDLPIMVKDLEAIAAALAAAGKEAGKFGDYLEGKGGEKPPAPLTAEQLQAIMGGGDLGDYLSLDEAESAFLRQHGFNVPAGERPFRQWERAHQDDLKRMLAQAGVGAPTPPPDTDPYDTEADYLNKHGFKGEFDLPITGGWVRRHRTEAEKDLAQAHAQDAAAAAAAPAAAAPNVTIHNVNITVTPDATAQAIAAKIKPELDKAKSQANSQSAMGG